MNLAPKKADPLLVALRARRLAIGASMTEVDGWIGTGRSGTLRRESGQTSPTLVVLRAWAEALGCDLALVPRTATPEVTDEIAGVSTVASMTRAGLSGNEIARRLGVSRRTVVRYRKREAA